MTLIRTAAPRPQECDRSRSVSSYWLTAECWYPDRWQAIRDNLPVYLISEHPSYCIGLNGFIELFDYWFPLCGSWVTVFSFLRLPRILFWLLWAQLFLCTYHWNSKLYSFTALTLGLLFSFVQDWSCTIFERVAKLLYTLWCRAAWRPASRRGREIMLPLKETIRGKLNAPGLPVPSVYLWHRISVINNRLRESLNWWLCRLEDIISWGLLTSNINIIDEHCRIKWTITIEKNSNYSLFNEYIYTQFNS